MRLVELTDLASNDKLSVNPDLVFGVRAASDGDRTWCNVFICVDHFPQNVLSVTESYETVCALLIDRVLDS